MFPNCYFWFLNNLPRISEAEVAGTSRVPLSIPTSLAGGEYSVGEDCAGLGTFGMAVEEMLQVVPGAGVAKHVFASELSDELRTKWLQRRPYEQLGKDCTRTDVVDKSLLNKPQLDFQQKAINGP